MLEGTEKGALDRSKALDSRGDLLGPFESFGLTRRLDVTSRQHGLGAGDQKAGHAMPSCST